MNKHERAMLFHDHAKAMLRGDASEALRIRDLLYPDQMLAHYVFVSTLFAASAFEHFGAELDREQLRQFMHELRAAHGKEGGRFRYVRAEAMIRVVYGEAELLIEIPHAEHTSYMWAVMRHLHDPAVTDAVLEERFAEAGEIAGEWVAEILESSAFAGVTDQVRPALGEPAQPEPAAQPEASGESEKSGGSAQ